MKNLKMFCLFAVVCLAMSTLAVAQGAAPAAKPAPQTQATPAPPAPSLISVVERQISMIEKEVVEAAEAMPEAKFNFTPESLNLQGSDYKGVRTFAVEVKHIASANYLFWASITGDKPPYEIKDPNGPDELKTKAEIIKYLKDSYAVGHKAAQTLKSDNLLDVIDLGPFGKAPRLYLATFGVAHGFDHYGQMVEYLRMNGIIPPASRGSN